MKKVNQSLVDVESDDFGTICLCAVRYAIGRETYMPTLVQSFIRPLLPYISYNSLYVIARDVREWGDKSGYGVKAYGMDFDYQDWMRFLAECDAEIAKRKNN